jgi:hypothetical protein
MGWREYDDLAALRWGFSFSFSFLISCFLSFFLFLFLLFFFASVLYYTRHCMGKPFGWKGGFTPAKQAFIDRSGAKRDTRFSLSVFALPVGVAGTKISGIRI